MSPTLAVVVAAALSLTSGLPAPLPAGADVDFVVVEADQEPREGRVLVSSFDDSNFRLPLPGAQDDDVVVIEAGEPDDRSGRFISDIPRDRNFGIVAGPRLPLPEDDIVVVEVADEKDGRSLSDIPRDGSAQGQAGFRLPLPELGRHSLNEDDDFEIVEVGDEDPRDSGRSLTPTNDKGFNQAAFRLPSGVEDDFVIIEAGPQEPRISTKVAADCLKPLTKSRCRASLVNYYYDSNTQSCEEFSFGGCDSDNHSNRFESLEECESVCLRA